MLTTSSRSFARQRERASLDRLWASKVRARDGYRCWVCGSRASDAAHLFSKRYQSTRWDLDNGRALCREHHVHYTKHDLEWKAYLGKRLGLEAFEALRARAVREGAAGLRRDSCCPEGGVTPSAEAYSAFLARKEKACCWSDCWCRAWPPVRLVISTGQTYTVEALPWVGEPWLFRYRYAA